MKALFGKTGALSAFAVLILLAGCQKSADRVPLFDADKVYTGADGRGYRLERLEKKPGGYAWVSKTMLRYYPHGFYEVEREDDAYFYVRQYVPVKVEPHAPEHAAPVASVVLPPSENFSWQEFDAGLPRAGQWRDNFAVADVNGDGFADLVFAPARKSFGKPVIFLGNGKGQWAPWTKARYPAVPYDYGGTAVADFNADGKPDLAFGVHLVGITMLSGDGKGGFSDDSDGLPRKRGGEQPTLSSRNVLAYDWNGDGKPALVVANEHMGLDPVRGMHDGVVVFLDDHGKWTAVANEAPLWHAVLIATDATAKKLALIEAPTREGSVRISERKAGGWSFHDVGGFPKDALLTAFAAADDRGADASVFVVAYRAHAMSTWWTYIDLIEPREGGWQRLPLSAQPGAAGVSALAFAKLRPGAFRDIVVLDEAGEAGILRQANEGHAYTRDRSLPAPPWRSGCQGYGLRTADLDKDGIDEVVVSFAGEGTALSKATECASGGAIQAFKISSKH